jgi:hypothetical protein
MKILSIRPAPPGGSTLERDQHDNNTVRRAHDFGRPSLSQRRSYSRGRREIVRAARNAGSRCRNRRRKNRLLFPGGAIEEKFDRFATAQSTRH